MQFDAALAAQDAFRQSQSELGSIGIPPLNWKSTSRLMPDRRREAPMKGSSRSPSASQGPFLSCLLHLHHLAAGDEETIAHHFQTGKRLSESYLASSDGKDPRHLAYVAELLESFRAGLGLDEEDEIQVEFRKDTPKGGD